MASSNKTSCNPAAPFVKLGDGNNAPILNYNLPQKTCYHGNAHFPLAIPASYFKAEYRSLPAANPWAQAAKLSLEEITNRLRSEILGSASPWFLRGASLIKTRNGIVRFLSDTGTKVLIADPKPVGENPIDNHLRLSGEAGQESTTPSSRPRINHLQVVPTLSAEKIIIAGYTLAYLAQQVKNGLIPELHVDFDRKVKIRFLPRPSVEPRITVVEHYKMCSFLGDYGAGKVVKTFSLLPGETSTISVRSYKDQTSSFVKSSSTQSNEYSSTYYAEDENSISTLATNALEGYSTHAANQLQSHIESLNHVGEGSSSTGNIYQDSSSGGGTQGGFNLIGLLNFQGGSGHQVAGGNSFTSNGYRESLLSNLNSAVSASVNESSSYRDVTVNSTTGNSANQSQGGNSGSGTSISVSQEESMLIKAGEESSTVRQLQNVNYSRVLNFVFRQMLQEYIAITWLEDVSIVLSTGFPGHRQVVKLPMLETFLATTFAVPAQRAEVRRAILLHLCNVANYQGVVMPFAERVTETFQDCVDGTQEPATTYWRKRSALSDSYTSGGLNITVPGVILSVQSHILRTDSVVVDALLGQGEALDCYNTRLQESAALSSELATERQKQEIDTEAARQNAALDILRAIGDPVLAAEAYKKMFGECCTEDMLLLLNANNSGASH